MNQSTVPPDIPTTEYWTTEFWPPVLTVHTAQIVYGGFSSTYYIVNVSVTATKYTPSEARLQSLDWLMDWTGGLTLKLFLHF